MAITICIDGAKPEEIERGLIAAQKVFADAGVTPEQAAQARFDVEVWDVSGFPDPAPDAALAIRDVWDEADEAAVKACCAGWDPDTIPRTAELELVRIDRTVFASEEERQEWLFATGQPGILEEICEEGYLDDGRPEDEVAFLLDEWDFTRLSERQVRLYSRRILPLIRLWCSDRDHFDAEYARLRALWRREDERQSDVQPLQPHPQR